MYMVIIKQWKWDKYKGKQPPRSKLVIKKNVKICFGDVIGGLMRLLRNGKTDIGDYTNHKT